MQIKTTLRFHLIPIRMAKVENTDNNMLKRLWGKGILLQYWWEYKLVQSLWMSVWQFLRKLGNNLPQDPAIPLLGMYPKDAQSCHKNMCSTMFIAALFVIARPWKQPKCPRTEEWIKKMWHIYKIEYYTTEKKTS